MVTGGHNNHCKVEFNMHVISHIFRPALSMIICHNFKKANRKPFDQVSILIPPFAFHFSKNKTQITLDDVRAAVGKVPPPPRTTSSAGTLYLIVTLLVTTFLKGHPPIGYSEVPMGGLMMGP